MGSIEKSVRALNKRDLAILEQRRQKALHEIRRAPIVAGWISGCGFLVFTAACFIATYLDHNGPRWQYTVAICAAIWTMIYLWSLPSFRKDARRQLEWPDSVLRHNQARETRVRSEHAVLIQGNPEEWPAYCFQLEDGKVLVLAHQDIADNIQFPNTDFSYVELCDEGGTVIDAYIATQGLKLEPDCTISVKTMDGVKLPETLKIVKGDVETVAKKLIR